ncbi:MAG TPA: hypothetical protein VGK94_14805 [Candidatus Polarisedimenticolia bacterium]|jgi:hypothetical protein
MPQFVEYVVEKAGIGSTTYFIASKEEGDGWISGFFPAYMAPDPDEVDEMIFDLANPDQTFTGATQDEAEQRIRDWVERKYKILERRTQRKRP